MNESDFEHLLVDVLAATRYPAVDGDCVASAERVSQVLGGKAVPVWVYGEAFGREVLLFAHVVTVVIDQGAAVVVDLTASQFSAAAPRMLALEADEYARWLRSLTGATRIQLDRL